MTKIIDIPEKVIEHANQKGITITDRKRYLNSWQNPKSKAMAIKAKCCECMGFEETAPRIKDCSIIICPLHRFRPFQTKSQNAFKTAKSPGIA